MFKVKLRLEQGIFSSCHGHSSLESCSAAFPPSPVMQTLLPTANLQTVSVLTQSNGCSQFDALLAGLQINLGRHTMPSCLTAAWKKKHKNCSGDTQKAKIAGPSDPAPCSQRSWAPSAGTN